MLSFILRYKYIIAFLLVALCVITVYLAWKKQTTQPTTAALPSLPITPLSNYKPRNIVLDKIAAIKETSGGVYSITRKISQEQYNGILQHWSPQTNIIQGMASSSILSWSNEASSVTIDLINATLAYENNELLPIKNVAVTSLDNAFSFGSDYLLSLPFFSGNPVPSTVSFLMKNNQLETIPTQDFNNADFIVLNYRESVSGIPIITKEVPSGNVYTLTIDKKGVVVSLHMSFFQSQENPEETITFLPPTALYDTAKRGDIAVIDIADLGAFIDKNSLNNNVVHITSTRPAYFLDDKNTTQAVYLVDAYIDYLGKKVSVTGLYPAITK